MIYLFHLIIRSLKSVTVTSSHILGFKVFVFSQFGYFDFDDLLLLTFLFLHLDFVLQLNGTQWETRQIRVAANVSNFLNTNMQIFYE